MASIILRMLLLAASVAALPHAVHAQRSNLNELNARHEDTPDVSKGELVAWLKSL